VKFDLHNEIESKTENYREEATDLYGWSYIFGNVSLFHDDILIDTRKYIDGQERKTRRLYDC